MGERQRLYQGFVSRSNMRRRYTNVAIPIEVADEIDRLIADPKLGYTSRAQFVLEAIRKQFYEIDKR